ncbi:MAG: GTPase HflX [Candidatus Riflebacteria bacterium]|nr:GTPase HflX [Candidatus Riflebacteria bacterium]
MREMKENKQEKAKVLAIAVQKPDQTDSETENSLIELSELLKTLGAVMVGQIVQKREDASRVEYLGTGKLEEAKIMAEKLEAEYVVADDELSAMQMRNIEKAIGLRVKDRTSVILDIFAAHASTREGKLQVDLAMLQYQYPRLLKMWTHLERQRGGIGLKGPGETQLETDRRIISTKIKKLEEELEKVAKSREQQGKKRIDRFAPLFSLVGYTNAGKSTLLNAISGSNVQMHNGLFTTLDPTARRIDLKDGYWCIVSDTVGFIRKLPHLLVKAFKATLESVVQSEVLLIVCDISDPQFREQLEAVERVLYEIGASNHEKIYVFNKIDKGQVVSDELLEAAYPNHIKISAVNKTNIDILLTKISEIMKRNRKLVKIDLPVGNQFMGDIMSIGKVYSQEWGQGVVTIKAELPNTYLNMLKTMPKIKIEEVSEL